jgi:hypothetical protein
MNLAKTTLTLLPLAALALASCTSNPASESTPANANAPADKAGSAKADEAKADALRKKQHELDYAKMQLEITRLDVQADERAAKIAVDNAERDLANAKAERDNFVSVLKPLEVAERMLALDGSKQRVTESEQEMSELEGMYSKEDFAKSTKELVLTRGRNHLAIAKRDLELDQKRVDQMSNFDHPKKEHDLAAAVDRATQAAAEAHAKQDKGTLEHKLSLLKAEHAIDDLQHEIAALEKPTG